MTSGEDIAIARHSGRSCFRQVSHPSFASAGTLSRRGGRHLRKLLISCARFVMASNPNRPMVMLTRLPVPLGVLHSLHGLALHVIEVLSGTRGHSKRLRLPLPHLTLLRVIPSVNLPSTAVPASALAAPPSPARLMRTVGFAFFFWCASCYL